MVASGFASGCGTVVAACTGVDGLVDGWVSAGLAPGAVALLAVASAVAEPAGVVVVESDVDRVPDSARTFSR